MELYRGRYRVNEREEYKGGKLIPGVRGVYGGRGGKLL